MSGYRVCGRFSANAGSSSFTCTLPRDATGPYRLLVYNGAPDGTARASSALILVNGVEVLGPHIFGFGSLTGGTPGPVRAEAEGIALGGYDSHGGWYVGDIGAIGAEVGGAQNYIGGFLGTETTSLCPSPTKIKLSEVSLGAEVPLLGGIGVGGGRYSTDDDRGTFFFVSGGILGKHASVGVGFSTQGWWETMKQWFE